MNYVTVDYVARIIKKFLGKKRKLVLAGFIAGLILGYVIGSKHPSKFVNKKSGQVIEKTIDFVKEKVK